MYRLASLVAVCVLFASACVPPEGEDNALEKTRPAIEMAADYDDLDAPVDYGFKVPNAATHPDAAGLPRWYCPKSVVTRAQMASFVARTMQGATAPLAAYEGGFSDVTGNNLHARGIAFVAKQGISVGCSDGAFCPDDGVTRGQMALFVSRMAHGADHVAPPAQGTYGDVPANHPHAGVIEQLAAAGIDLSCGPERFCPDRPISRDEIASFLVAVKYRDGSAGTAVSVFSDVAQQNPNLTAVNILARDGVTFGCEAPRVGFRLNGEPITERQRDWLLYFAGRTLPRLSRAYGDTARAFTVGARVVWWSLKEGVFGHFDDPFRHAVCNGSLIGPFETCPGEWEVGLTATTVPADAEVMGAAAALYPESTPEDVALSLVEFGRTLSDAFDAGEYPAYATEWVLKDAALRRSWLARDATIGAWLLIDDIERDCIDGSADWCFGTDWEATRDFASDRQVAEQVQGDLRRILVALRPR